MTIGHACKWKVIYYGMRHYCPEHNTGQLWGHLSRRHAAAECLLINAIANPFEISANTKCFRLILTSYASNHYHHGHRRQYGDYRPISSDGTKYSVAVLSKYGEGHSLMRPRYTLATLLSGFFRDENALTPVISKKWIPGKKSMNRTNFNNYRREATMAWPRCYQYDARPKHRDYDAELSKFHSRDVKWDGWREVLSTRRYDNSRYGNAHGSRLWRIAHFATAIRHRWCAASMAKLNAEKLPYRRHGKRWYYQSLAEEHQKIPIVCVIHEDCWHF